MTLLPKRITPARRKKINKFMKSHLSPRQEIAFNIAMNGPIKKNKKFKFTKSGVKRVRR